METAEIARSRGMVVHQWPGAPSAWDVARRLAGLPRLVFLDSALPGHLGRYSFVLADPYQAISGGDAFGELEHPLRRDACQPLPGLPPFQGGAAGVFGYELAGQLERVPRARVDELGLPDLAVGMYDLVVAYDHQAGRAWKISTGLPELGPTRLARAEARMAQLDSWLAEGTLPDWGARSSPPALCVPVPGHPGIGSSGAPGEVMAAIRRAIEYVHAGDCFQVNLAQRLVAPVSGTPLELYGRLRQVSPAPFAGLANLGGGAWVLSSSPERFVEVRGGIARARPIKGTRPRGATQEEDRALAEALLASPKDRAENVMIVDLLRNDLGRVCQYGSVQVDSVCRLESYRSVHHLVSEVRGKLCPGLGPVDLLRAGFPGGSVTGAPKVRAMEVIAELEPVVRGPYCGSLGYIGLDGSMDLNILIRTMTVCGGWAYFHVGGGIVADSSPEEEYFETLHKAAGMITALRG
jgi:para-aminobenzoate synthetase component 1